MVFFKNFIILWNLSTKFCVFRLKYGIGRPGQDGIHAAIPVERFVLASFSDDELSLLNDRISVVMQGVEHFVVEGSQKAMNVLNVIK